MIDTTLCMLLLAALCAGVVFVLLRQRGRGRRGARPTPDQQMESHHAQPERSVNLCHHFIDDEGNISHIRVRRSTE